MFGRWRKRSEDEKTSQALVVQRPSASEIDAEYGDYTARIRKTLVFGAILGVFGAAAFGFVSWTTQSSSASERSGGTDVGPTVILAALPASIMLAGFSILAALAIALQLAVRTPSVTETRPATAVARRRFLCSIASLVVPSSVALAAYSTPAALAGAPETLDLVRLFGPWLCAAFVAVIAADAGVASDPEYDRAEMGRLYRARVARRVLVGLRMVGERDNEVTSRSITWQAFVLAGAPAATAILSFAAAPELLPRQAVALVVLALVVAGVVYVIATRVYINTIARDWVAVSGIIVGTVMVGAIGWVILIGVSAQWMFAERSLMPAATTVAWALVYLVVPAIVAAWSLIPFNDGRPRVLGLVVRRALVKKLKNRNRSVQRSNDATFNGLALVAPWLSPFLPFGIVLGVIAKQQIRRSRIARGQQEQRGEWAANLAIGLSLFFVVVLIVVLLCVGAIDTPEWNEFVWG